MRIIQIDFYLDGGTAMIKTDEGTFYVDNRLGTTTPNKVFDAYPDSGKEIPEIVTELKQALEEAKYDNSYAKLIRIA